MGRASGEGEVQEPGELLERVGAARHDNAVELTIGGEQRGEVARQPRAVVHREDGARQVGERLCLEPGETFGCGSPATRSLALSRPVRAFPIVPPVAMTRTRGSGRAASAGGGALARSAGRRAPHTRQRRRAAASREERRSPLPRCAVRPPATRRDVAQRVPGSSHRTASWRRARPALEPGVHASDRRRFARLRCGTYGLRLFR